MSLAKLIQRVDNWKEVLLYYLLPAHLKRLKIRFRNGLVLAVPEDYIFEAIAETLLLNVYGFENLSRGAVVVDVGASIGDFTLLASMAPHHRVYAYEPSQKEFHYMQFNLITNRRTSVLPLNASARSETLDSILEKYGETEIDFLKIDCEGCEYLLLLGCSSRALSKVKRIAMEIHTKAGFSKRDIIRRLEGSGFSVRETKRFGHGSYLHASVDPSALHNP